MFDFEKLDIYHKAKEFNSSIRRLFKYKKLDRITRDQLHRASFSIVLNIAEGSGRFSKRDRRNFYVIARSSVFECVAILDVLRNEGNISSEVYAQYYNQVEELSKMLFAMIRNLDVKV